VLVLNAGLLLGEGHSVHCSLSSVARNSDSSWSSSSRRQQVCCACRSDIWDHLLHCWLLLLLLVLALLLLRVKHYLESWWPGSLLGLG
jgi:hypothetical protein